MRRQRIADSVVSRTYRTRRRWFGSGGLLRRTRTFARGAL